MNLISQKITNWQQRKAITLVEVLTSITVAVIGVAGVLILIPFATQQANVGLTLAESTTIAENSISRFRIEGFNRVITIDGQNVLPWIVPRQPNVQRTFANLNVRGEELADLSLVTTTDPPRNFPRSISLIHCG